MYVCGRIFFLAHVACTCTYSGQVQERKYGHVCVHTGGVSNAYSRIRTARDCVHGWVGTKKQHHRRGHGEATECVMFMGRQQNASCSWGGNRMRRVHREATKRVGANRLGRNGMRGHVHREGLDRTGDGKRGLAYRKTEETALCSTGDVRNGILFIGRGLAYRKTEEMDFSWTSNGRNGVLLIGRGAAYRKTDETDLLRSKRGSC